MIPPRQNVPNPNAANRAIFGAGAAVLAVAALIFGSIALARSESQPQPKPEMPAPVAIDAPSARPAPPAITEPRPSASDRWEQVASVFEKSGLSVEARDPVAPYTMRVHVPSTLAMDMTAFQARELAASARDRIDAKAIVYIKSEGGQTLAKAAPWGIE